LNIASAEGVLDPPATSKGWITAFDAETGAVRWKVETPKPIFAAVTPTAGDVVFAADVSGLFYALDADGGQLLWSEDLGQANGGGIITYRARGRQLVAIASGLKSATLPFHADVSRIVVYGLRCNRAHGCGRDDD